MNSHMYENEATQANLRILRNRGVEIVEPGVGRLASKGEQGVGRLAEPARLLEACEAVLAGSTGGHPGGSTTESWRGLKGVGYRRGYARADRQRAVRRQQLLRAYGLRLGAGCACPRS